MTDSTDRVRADFDRIARLPDDDCGHNEFYHDFLLNQLPARCDHALEIGCGTGRFTMRLAARARHVVGLDLSPGMISVARRRLRSFNQIDYVLADAMKWRFPPERFDCVASIATLHHLCLETILNRVRDSLRPGGTFAALDLYKVEHLPEYVPSLVAGPASMGRRLLKTGRLRPPEEVHTAWEAHSECDVFLTLSEVRRVCDKVLPGAQVRRHLFWRYSIVWTKPVPETPPTPEPPI